ncbi:MAG: hypothetical protein ACM3SV_02915 [Betaproteobacteria bacterium]
MATASGWVQAMPVSVTQNVSFQANNQSFWGGGTGYKFGSAGQFGPSAVNFSWDIGASTGTVDAAVAGGMTSSYNNLRYGPGSVPFNLGFSGQANGGALSSDLGAWARASVTLGFTLPLIDYGFGLNPATTFTPVLGQQYSASDFGALAGTGVDIGVFSTGVNFGIGQDESLLLQSITGTLKYGLKGSGVVNSLPFSLGASSSTVLNPLLSQAGVWELWLADLELNALFSTDFDLELLFYETHPDGIRWCSRKVWGITLRWPCGLSYDTNEWEVASLNVYDGKPFYLDFDSTVAGARFEVSVVPEPPMLLLLVPAFLTLLATRRRVFFKHTSA